MLTNRILTAASVLLLITAPGCSKKPPPVTAPPVFKPQIAWIEVTKESFSDLVQHDRAILVTYADWSITSSSPPILLDTPSMRKVLNDTRCKPLKFNITDEEDFHALRAKFPTMKELLGHVLLKENGKLIADIDMQNVEQELKTRYNKE